MPWNNTKIFKSALQFGVYFYTGYAGGSSLLYALDSKISLPPFIAFPVMVGVGLAAGVYGYYNQYNALLAAEIATRAVVEEDRKKEDEEKEFKENVRNLGKELTVTRVREFLNENADDEVVQAMLTQISDEKNLGVRRMLRARQQPSLHSISVKVDSHREKKDESPTTPYSQHSYSPATFHPDDSGRASNRSTEEAVTLTDAPPLTFHHSDPGGIKSVASGHNPGSSSPNWYPINKKTPYIPPLPSIESPMVSSRTLGTQPTGFVSAFFDSDSVLPDSKITEENLPMPSVLEPRESGHEHSFSRKSQPSFNRRDFNG